MLAHHSLDTLADAVVAAAPRLDEVERRIALASYRELATGRPATAAAIGRRAGVDERAVARRLERWTGVFRRSEDDAVVGFWGLAIPEMPHRIRVGSVDLHAWCAWDPLFLACVLGELDVETADPVTGERIGYHVDATGAVSQPSRPATVLSFLAPDDEWGDDVISTFCHLVLHFADRSTGERWIAEHPGTILLTLDEAAEIGRRFAERVFGSAVPDRT